MSIAMLARSVVWRVGRKMYSWARQDGRNDPEANGEYWLLDAVVASCETPVIVLLDIGANVGNWTQCALEVANRVSSNVAIHAFEPCEGTRLLLERNVEGLGQVHVHKFAMSVSPGEAHFFSSGAGLGTNSLSSSSGTHFERVQLNTIDAFLRSNEIPPVAMVKIDTEGFDFDVMRGAEQSLRQGLIDIIQFEYNWRWLLNGASMLSVFRFVEGKPYTVGKLAGNQILLFDKWHFELDRFFENNYVLLRKGSHLEKIAERVEFNQHNVMVSTA